MIEPNTTNDIPEFQSFTYQICQEQELISDKTSNAKILNLPSSIVPFFST